MKITNAWLVRFSTTGSEGWTRKQLACLGVAWPPRRGWKYRLEGREIPDATARAFEREGLRNRREHFLALVDEDDTW